LPRLAARERRRRHHRAPWPARQRGGQLPQHSDRRAARGGVVYTVVNPMSTTPASATAIPATGGAAAPARRSKIALYVQLARPFTLLPPLLGIVSGAVCAFGSVHNPDPARQLTWSVVLTVALGSLCAA